MKRLLFLLATSVFCLATAAQLRNPILPGFHPDPSVCRVDGDFYLVNSSFQYFPGVPIYHSTDLEHWQQIGNVLSRPSQLKLKGATSWQGIYAPTIRYHAGTYYMITTNVGHNGRTGRNADSENFMVTAKNPAGPWSEPIWLQQGGIDPSLYFEGNKCYMVSNPDNTITLCEIDAKTGRQLTKSRAIWQGTGGRYPEGPHIYKKDGYYYLLISEGGTELAHSLTMARSKNIYGPYTPNPQNPIFTHCSRKGQYSQIQGTGHGDLVQKQDGSWWLVMLAYRNFNGSYHHLGRETYLAPVEWKAGEWPVVNGGNPIDTAATAQKRRLHYDFTKPLGPEWLHIQEPDTEAYELKDGRLRLFGSILSMKENKQPTFVGLRQESANICVDTKVTLLDGENGDQAGLCVYQINDGFAQMNLQNRRGSHYVRLCLQLKDNLFTMAEQSVPATAQVWMQLKSDGEKYYFSYSTDGKSYEQLGAIECLLLSTEVAGGFTGVIVGMHSHMASSKFQTGRSFADFDFFDYQEN